MELSFQGYLKFTYVRHYSQPFFNTPNSSKFMELQAYWKLVGLTNAPMQRCQQTSDKTYDFIVRLFRLRVGMVPFLDPNTAMSCLNPASRKTHVREKFSY